MSLGTMTALFSQVRRLLLRTIAFNSNLVSLLYLHMVWGFPGGSDGKESA